MPARFDLHHSGNEVGIEIPTLSPGNDFWGPSLYLGRENRGKLRFLLDDGLDDLRNLFGLGRSGLCLNWDILSKSY